LQILPILDKTTQHFDIFQQRIVHKKL
jgi:hypothetical protein